MFETQNKNVMPFHGKNGTKMEYCQLTCPFLFDSSILILLALDPSSAVGLLPGRLSWLAPLAAEGDLEVGPAPGGGPGGAGERPFLPSLSAPPALLLADIGDGFDDEFFNRSSMADRGGFSSLGSAPLGGRSPA